MFRNIVLVLVENKNPHIIEVVLGFPWVAKEFFLIYMVNMITIELHALLKKYLWKTKCQIFEEAFMQTKYIVESINMSIMKHNNH